MNNLNRNQVIVIAAALLIVLFFVLVFLGIIPGLRPKGSASPYGGSQTQLTIWGAQNSNIIQTLINNYKASGVQITYQQFDEANYEKKLINALASGNGPDIFFFHNTWLPKHIDKIAPADAQITLAQFQSLYPTVAQNDFTKDGKIYSLPLYIDTLAFIYNKDIFDKKSIALPPQTWSDLENLIPRLRGIDASGRITQSAVAIGGSQKSIDTASDLLSQLMMQFGAKMSDSSIGRANFYKTGGLDALNLYLSFSNPNSNYYTWNDNLRYSLDSFANGQTASIFNYASSLPIIKEKNPYLSIAVSPMLQQDASNPINYANYWGLAVSRQSKNQSVAWNFIISTLSNPQISSQYLQAAQLPPALKSLIPSYQNDPIFSVFANQTLPARSWQQPDSNIVSQTFSSMIESILSGKISPDNALEQAENSINSISSQWPN